MKIAIVHDYLCGIGGAERVFQYICEEFPEADVFTLAYNPKTTLPYFKSINIRTTWLNRFVQSMDAFRWSFPIATYVMESIDLRGYDVVLSSSATVAKYVKVPNGKHLCYCYIPTRALWQTDAYFRNGLKAFLVKSLLSYLRRRDYFAAQSVNQFIAISQFTKDKITETYNRNSNIIFSPIDLDRFAPLKHRGSHYLIVSRLEQWKRVDYAIEAFTQLGLPLRVIGTGIEENRLRSIAGPTISFLGAVEDDVLAHEYAEAKAVVFTPFLEYGLVPLEANACGTPVICYGVGGITETMNPWSSNKVNSVAPTAIFFFEQTAQALAAAVKQFEQANFDSAKLVEHAKLWSVPAFKKQLRDAVNALGASQ